MSMGICVSIGANDMAAVPGEMIHVTVSIDVDVSAGTMHVRASRVERRRLAVSGRLVYGARSSIVRCSRVLSLLSGILLAQGQVRMGAMDGTCHWLRRREVDEWPTSLRRR